MLPISHDPFVHDAFERFFVPLFTTNAAPARPHPRVADHRVELSATDDGWTLFAEMPGVAAEQVDLEVGEHDVKLSFERPSDAPEGMRRLGGDRTRGPVQRHWRVRRAIDSDSVETHFEKGRLTVHIKARGAAGPRKIAIKSA